MIYYLNLSPAWEALIWMLIGHALADYPLQGDWLAKAKNPTLEPVPGESIWFLALLSHSAIHAGFVAVATGSWQLASFELVAHFFIDLAKCFKKISYNHDQVLHIWCKVLMFLLLWESQP